MSSSGAPDNDLSVRTDSINTSVADGLRAAAGALTKPGQVGNAEGIATRAADVLNRSADYVDEMDLKRIKEDVVDQVRRNPGRSLLIAGAAGLILGALFRRR